MSAWAIIIVLCILALLVYGLWYEEKVIAFEQAVVRIVVGHYRRLKRKILNKVIDRKVMEICKRF